MCVVSHSSETRCFFRISATKYFLLRAVRHLTGLQDLARVGEGIDRGKARVVMKVGGIAMGVTVGTWVVSPAPCPSAPPPAPAC